MSVVISGVKHVNAGNARFSVFDVTGPVSYTTGGETLTLAQQRQIMNETAGSSVDFTKATFFLSEVNHLATNAAGLTWVLDKTNNKLVAYKLSTTADQVANGIDLSTAASKTRCRVMYDIENG